MKFKLILICSLTILARANSNTKDDILRDSFFRANSKVDGPLQDTIVFAVDSVALPPTLMPEHPILDVLQWKIGKKIAYSPSNQTTTTLVHTYGDNALLQTIHKSYDEHRPLILSPDAIWLTICQGVSIHINEHFAELKSTLFKANKPNQLYARNDSLEGNADQWASLIGDLSNQTKKYTQRNAYSFFVPQFSTTSTINITAYQITLMHAFKKAFSYVGESGCGIPSISLRGNTADWEFIYQKLEVLDEFNLTDWKNELKPILHEFIEASKGNINRSFWQEIYKYALEYNGFYTSGWIIKLFPYLNSTENDGVWDEKQQMERVTKTYRPNHFLYGTDYRKSTLSPGAFPSGIADVDLLWDNYGQEIEMTLYAGFFGTKQNADMSLEPYISWAITEKNAPINDDSPSWLPPLELDHDHEYWSPNFAKIIKYFAVYNPLKYNNPDESLLYLKLLIKDSLASNKTTSTIPLNGLVVEIEIYSSGESGDVVLKGTPEQVEKLSIPIKNLISNLPEVWLPAMTHPSAVLSIMGEPIDPKMLVKVNSKIQIAF